MTVEHETLGMKVRWNRSPELPNGELFVVLLGVGQRTLGSSVRLGMGGNDAPLVATIVRALKEWRKDENAYLLRSINLSGIRDVLLLECKYDAGEICPRSTARVLAEHSRSLRAQSVVMCSNLDDALPRELLALFLEEFALGYYSYRAYKSRDKALIKLPGSFTFWHLPALQPRPQAFCNAMVSAASLARDLVNMPPSDCTPHHLVRVAEGIAKDQKLRCQIFDERRLEKQGANAILAVGKGSANDSYLIHLGYRPRKASKSRLALVGKGVTFDSGGLCIKTRAGMSQMKVDMAGAAAVLGAMSVIRTLEPSYEVDAYIPTVENMLGAAAFRPGDVLRSMSGQTIEVLNTDAEGRLILADALHLAVQEGATTIIDIATLTGACATALGDGYAGLFCNDQKLSAKLLACAARSGEALWPLPLPPHYGKYIKSMVADIKNTGTDRGGGAITAALFLQRFVGQVKWAHLDIVSTAFAEDTDFFGVRGATGFGARLFGYFLAEKGP